MKNAFSPSRSRILLVGSGEARDLDLNTATRATSQGGEKQHLGHCIVILSKSTFQQRTGLSRANEGRNRNKLE